METFFRELHPLFHPHKIMVKDEFPEYIPVILFLDFQKILHPYSCNLSA